MKVLISAILILLVTSSFATTHHLKKAKHQHHHQKKLLHAFTKSHIKQTENDYQDALAYLDQERQDTSNQIKELQETLEQPGALDGLVDDAFTQMDANEDGRVLWEEFQNALASENGEDLPSLDDIRAIFDQYNVDGSEGLDFEEIRAVVEDLVRQAIEALQGSLDGLNETYEVYEEAYEQYQQDHPAPVPVDVAVEDYIREHDASPPHIYEDERQNENADDTPQQHGSEHPRQSENAHDAPREHASEHPRQNENADDAPQQHGTEHVRRSENVDDALFLLQKNQNKHNHKLRSKMHTKVQNFTKLRALLRLASVKPHPRVRIQTA